MCCALGPKGRRARGPFYRLLRGELGTISQLEPFSCPMAKAPSHVSDEGSGLGCGTGGRGCYVASPVSYRAEAAFTTVRLRYGGSPTRLTAACSLLFITTSSALEPSSPQARGPLSVGPQHLGALAARPVHTPPPAGALIPLPCAPHPALASPPCGLRAPLLSCGPWETSRQVPAAEGRIGVSLSAPPSPGAEERGSPWAAPIPRGGAEPSLLIWC